MKALNSWPGFPDLIIFERRGEHIGLCIEIKKGGTSVFKKDGELRSDKHLEEQKEWLDHLYNLGFKTCFAIGLDEAMEQIKDYMGLPPKMF